MSRMSPVSTALLVVVAAQSAGAQRHVARPGAQRVDTAYLSPPLTPVNTLACHTSPAPRAPSADSSGGASRLVEIHEAPYRPRAIDTTIVLAIADHRWTASQYDGGIALGTDSSGRVSHWNACAGAAVHLGQATAALHNVRGSIHLRIDPTALTHLGGTSSPVGQRDSSPTPPAAPPRR
jgi:hypothetical protein